MTLSTTEENENKPLRSGKDEEEVDDEDEAARADKRRKPAM
jgi:hypothetical protein